MSLFINYWTLASFATLIITTPHWPFMPTWFWLVPCLVWLLFSFYCRRLRWGCGVAIALIVILINGNLLHHQSNSLFQSGTDIIITAHVDSLFKPIKRGFQGIASVRSINGEQLNTLYRPKVYLIAPQKLQLGDRVTARVRLKPIIGVLNSVGFDREKYAVSQRVTGVASINAKSSYFIENILSLRQVLFNRMFQATRGLDNQGLLLALSFGERSYISPNQWQQLQQSGLSHLIAISGLHIGIAFSVGWFLGLGLIRIGFQKIWLPMCVGGAAALSYAWLAGFAIPTQRALWMVGVILVFRFSGLHTSYRYTWLLVVSTLLFVEPLAVYANSFWLSISAVAIIFFLLSLQFPIRSVLLRALLMQFCLVVVMALLVAGLFHGISLHAFIYNLLFVPWFSFVIVPCLLIAIVLSTISRGISDVLFEWVNALLTPVTRALSYSGSLWFELSQQTTLWLMVVFIVVLSSVILRRRVHVILAITLVSALMFRRENEGFRMDLLDVGHGLAVVIEKNHHALLYDTGAAWEQASHSPRSGVSNTNSYAKQVILPYLIARGLTLDSLILSHFDNDHAGGYKHVLQRWPAVTLWASQSLEASVLNQQACTEGQVWQWQGLRIEVLWPPKLTVRAYNPHSCVIRVQDIDNEHSILLTGDIEAVAEWLILRQPQYLDSDVVVVPHHGSKSSSSQRFVAAVSPTVALASTAYQGRWSLPNIEVKQRYLDAGAVWLDTGTSGHISIQYQGKTRRLVSLRATKGKAWYRQMLRKRVE